MSAAVLDRAASGSSMEEEEDQEADVEASIFEQYLSVCDEATVDPETDALFAKGLLRVQQYLAGGRDNTTCPICLGGIKPTEAIWACGKSCYALFHMTCVQEWARNQLDTAAYKASRDPSLAAAAREWGCPSCRYDYPSSEVPQQYSCFCGKKEDPEWDPWLAPHSCGELCGKPLPGSCSHSCLLLCHPGPCPPCPLLVDASCFCGKAHMKQRCGNNEFSCRAVCGKRMPCGHACPDVCHAGPCGPCQEVVAASCACGEQQSRRPCHLADWHCEKTCGKLLACGRHTCDQVCHSGPCGSCPEEGERRCPCGKALYRDLKCDEKAPLCGGTCGKTLDCGVHTCQERCHYGPCNKVCRELVSKPCRCGRSSKQVLCSADVRCDSKCNNMRSCDRHPCKRRCCDGNCPPCEEVCNRKLRCGNHRCPATCHRGPCRPCPLSQTISCACGRTSYTLPCGAEAAAAPPRCAKMCPVQPVCRHAADAKPHRCHFGPCPPCRSPCGTALTCGHTCSSSTCHDPQPPAVPGFERPKPPKSQVAAVAAAASGGSGSGGGASSSDTNRRDTRDAEPQQPPAAAAAAAAAAMAAAGPGPCPACTVPVQVGCLGGHCQRPLPCCSAAAFSCGAQCGRPLACGHHSCSKPCHAVKGWSAAAAAGGGAGAAAAAAAVAAAAVGMECEVCVRPCAQPRSCSHPCPSTCHPGPCQPCEVEVSMECYCGKTDLTFPCSEHQQVLKQQHLQRLAGGSGTVDALCCGKVCHRELPFCPHTCTAVCHTGACPEAQTCREEVTVRCSCRRQKEKWACAKVQAALAAASPGSNGSSKLYDGSSALKLLPCDGLCAAAAKEKQQPQPQSQQGAAAAGGSSSDASPRRSSSVKAVAQAKQEPQKQQQAVAAAAATAAAAAAAAASVKSTKKLSRAERDALAAAKEAERLKLQRQQQMRQAGIIAAVVLVVLLVGFGLSFGLEQLVKALKAADATLQDKYAPNREL